MATPVLVNASTSIVQVDSSQIVSGSPAIVWLSTLNAPGTVITVRDSYGDCSLTKQIVVSTTKDVHYLDGPLVSSYTINQPYGFLTVTPKTSTIWGVVNTYAFPDASRAAVMNTLNVNTLTTSSLTNNLAYISSLTVSSFTADSVNLNSSIVTLQSTITNAMYASKDGWFGQNVRVGSTLTAASSIQTRVAKVTSTLEVPQLDVQFSTGIALNVAGQLIAIGAISTLSSIYAGDLISTTSNLGVGGNSFLLGQLRGRGNVTFEGNQSTVGTLGVGKEALFYSTLITRDIAYFNSHVSTASNLLVAGGISTLSNLHVGCNTTIGQDLRIIGNLSTHGRVDVGGTMSIAGNLAVGGDIFFADRLVDLDNLSVTQTLYVGNTISTLSSIAAGTSLQVQGSTLLLGHVSAFSTMSVRGNVSTLGSLAVGGSSEFLSTLLVKGSISTLSNLTVAGVISTPSSIIAGDILQVRNAIYGFSSMALNSSLQVGGTMSVAGYAYIQGALSTLGQTAIFSSLQVQGSLSVMSSVAVSCNLAVNGILTAGSFNLPGAGNLLTLGVTSNAGFVATVSSSTLHMGLFSSMGGMNLAGFFSTTNAIASGSTMNTNFLTATRGMSTLSNLGVGNDLQVLSNTIIGGQLSNLGAATFQSNTTFNGGTATTATFNTVPTFNQNVTMTQELNVKQLGLFENTLRIYGSIDCWNGIGTKAGPNNTFSNFTNLSSMAVQGLATFSNITNASNLNTTVFQASSITAMSNIFSSVVASTIVTSSITIADIQTSRRIFTSSILTSTIQTASTISLQGLFSSLQASSFTLATGVTTLQVFTSSIRGSNLAINTTNPRALIDVVGGSESLGQNGSNIMAIQYYGGAFRHFIAARHNGAASSIGNAIQFFPNNGVNAEDSSTAGTSNVLAVSMTPVGVGIYTSTPSYSLDVQGSLGVRNIGATTYGHVKLFPRATNAENCITFYSTTTLDNSYPWMVGLLNGISPNFVVSPISNTNYNAALTTHFTRDGRVGIGNASPAFKLDVAGTGRFDTSLTVGSSFAVEPNPSGYLRVKLNGGNSFGHWYGAFNGLGDGVHMGYNAYYENNVGWTIPSSGGQTSRISMFYGQIGMYVGGTNSAPTTAAIYINNTPNVGIGTVTPGYKLEVNGTAFFRDNVGLDTSDYLYFNNSTGRKISLWGLGSNSYYGFEIQSGELRATTDGTSSRHTWGFTSATPTFTEWMSLSNGILITSSNHIIKGVGNAASRLIIGPAPSHTNLDYSSVIQSCNASANNYGSELSFWTHGTAATNADPTRAVTIDSSQRVTMLANNTWAGRGSNPMPANLILQDANGSGVLKLAANYTGGQASGGTIQASDFYSNTDHGVSLFINPLGGYVAIGSSNAPTSPFEVTGNTKITGNLTVTGIGGFVVGMIIAYNSSTAPAGWAICNGGTSNGQTTPDLRQRFIIQAGGGYTHNTSNNIVTSSVTLSINHVPPHRHYYVDTTPYGSGLFGGSYWGGRDDGKYTGGDIRNSANAVVTAEGSNPSTININGPYYVLTYIMYVGF